MTQPSFQTPLEEITGCFQGIIPSVVCSASPDGRPNITNLSIVLRTDGDHVALSRQFFNKTARNLTVNPHLQVLVVEPQTGRQFRLDLLHETTELSGPLFERMQARLDVVASESGMSEVFNLRGIDVCKVVECREVPLNAPLSAPPDLAPQMDRLFECQVRIDAASDIESLLTISLQAFEERFGFDRSLFLALDEAGKSLYVLASRGYPESGAGAQVELGVGAIGVAAQRGTAVRVVNRRRDRIFTEAVRASLPQAISAERQIALPGIEDVTSELAVPVIARDQLRGVLYFQSEVAGRFSADDESAAGLLAKHIGLTMQLLRLESVAVTTEASAALQPRELMVKHYAADDSVFIDDDYIIRGVAGRLLWRLLQLHSEQHRSEFTNREFRLDPSLDLPGYKDNLETRLILLRKRLADRSKALSITSTGRGTFRFTVQGAVNLQEIG